MIPKISKQKLSAATGGGTQKQKIMPPVNRKSMLGRNVKTKIAIPKPKLLINSDWIYSLTTGCNFGTKIIVTTVDNIHFMNEIKLKENPFKKHWITL